MAHNNYFKFKQFTVRQEQAAMKVGTDGVLLGAWTNVEKTDSVLDIGTGTGLIALMLAQRTVASVDAIDIEANAIADAGLNFSNSPWAMRMKAIHASLQDFTQKASIQYDCIVCNPPFFVNSKKAEGVTRNLARHTDSLSFSQLAQGVSLLLNPNGAFNVVLPADAEREFRNAAGQFRLFASRVTRVKPNPKKPIKRVLMEFRFEALPDSESLLTIESEKHHDYTLEYRQLVEDYYLNM